MKWLKPREAAKKFGINFPRIYEWIRKGRLKDSEVKTETVTKERILVSEKGIKRILDV